MKVITGGRGSGISTQLVLESAFFQIPILCRYSSRAEHLDCLAKEMNLIMPRPVCLSHNLRGISFPKGVIIDDLEDMLKNLLAENGVNTKIHAVGQSFDIERY